MLSIVWQAITPLRYVALREIESDRSAIER